MVIDVSHHNGNIDWKKVSFNTPKIEGVIIKVSQGTTIIDSKAVINAQGAVSVGLPIGYYHFATLNSTDVVTDATNEANWFITQVKKLPPPSLFIALDIELNEQKISPQLVLTYIKTFIAILKASGFPYKIYSGKYFLNDNLPKNHGLGNIGLWHAQYSQTLTPSIADGWSHCDLWQYSGTGTVSGIVGSVDLNKWMQHEATKPQPIASVSSKPVNISDSGVSGKKV